MMVTECLKYTWKRRITKVLVLKMQMLRTEANIMMLVMTG